MVRVKFRLACKLRATVSYSYSYSSVLQLQLQLGLGLCIVYTAGFGLLAGLRVGIRVKLVDALNVERIGRML